MHGGRWRGRVGNWNADTPVLNAQPPRISTVFSVSAQLPEFVSGKRVRKRLSSGDSRMVALRQRELVSKNIRHRTRRGGRQRGRGQEPVLTQDDFRNGGSCMETSQANDKTQGELLYPSIGYDGRAALGFLYCVPHGPELRIITIDIKSCNCRHEKEPAPPPPRLGF
jgi:hypothetical protein